MMGLHECMYIVVNILLYYISIVLSVISNSQFPLILVIVHADRPVDWHRLL